MTKAKENISASYNKYKIFNGKQYTGMKVGRSHKWYYDKGIWYDKKLTPDKWLVSYESIKRRTGNAPEGSGAPVGTEYHWYIMAHQIVKKLDANSYTTEMNGMKFKLAHKRRDKDIWSATDKTQRKNLIKILKEFIKELEEEPIEDYVNSEGNQIKPEKNKKTIKSPGQEDGLPKKTKRKKVLANTTLSELEE